MALFLVKRLISLVATLVGTSGVVFLVLDVLPGNAAQLLMGPDASPEAVAALAVKLGLDQGALTRYLHWMGGLLTGDLGTSYAYGTPVGELIAQRLAVTVPLAVLAMALTVALALAAGSVLLLALLAVGGLWAVTGGGKPVQPSGRPIQRFTRWQRIVHWTTAISFLLLAFTGLIILFGKVVLLPLLPQLLPPPPPPLAPARDPGPRRSGEREPCCCCGWPPQGPPAGACGRCSRCSL